MTASAPRLRVQHTPEGTFLWVDGSCASFRRRGRETTGGSWDLLAAPVLLCAAPRAPRVLLLGVGGGTVARIVRALRPDAVITGIELDDAVLDIARRAFGLDALAMRVVRGDARRYLAALPAARRFDLIVDDIYTGHGDAMHKPPGWPAALRRAHARLRPGGALICNALDAADARVLRPIVRPAFELVHADYYNHFLVHIRGAALSARAAARILHAAPLLADAMRRSRVTSL